MVHSIVSFQFLRFLFVQFVHSFGSFAVRLSPGAWFLKCVNTEMCCLIIQGSDLNLACLRLGVDLFSFCFSCLLEFSVGGLRPLKVAKR